MGKLIKVNTSAPTPKAKKGVGKSSKTGVKVPNNSRVGEKSKRINYSFLRKLGK